MTDNILPPQVMAASSEEEKMEVDEKKSEEVIADFYSKTFKHFVAGKNKN